MADRLTAMQVFVRAMRLGTLSAAAREMQISPTMAGKHVDALEAHLGTVLMHRSTRRLTPTAAGLGYLQSAERLLQELGEIEAEAAAHAASVDGLLRVTAPATFGALHLPALLPGFRARYPKVTVEFGFTDRKVDLLEERWDVAIRIGALADSALVARRIAPVRMVLCAAPSYLARAGWPERVADLAGHECLTYVVEHHGPTARWRFGATAEVAVDVAGPVQANNGEALLQAAAAGLGLAYLPRFVAATALAAGQVVEVALDHPPTGFGAIHTVTHPGRRPVARTRAWIDFLVETLPGLARNW